MLIGSVAQQKMPILAHSSAERPHSALIWQYVYSHKNVFQMKTSTCREGTLKNQPNKMGTTPQHIYIIPTSCAIFPTICFVFVSCVQSRVVEGSWEGIARCIAHVEVHGECVCCRWKQCSCY